VDARHAVLVRADAVQVEDAAVQKAAARVDVVLLEICLAGDNAVQVTAAVQAVPAEQIIAAVPKAVLQLHLQQQADADY